MDIEAIIESFWLTVRAQNTCRKAGFQSDKDLLEFYHKYGDFRRIRHCGNKTNKELKLVCEQLLSDQGTNGSIQGGGTDKRSFSQYSQIQFQIAEIFWKNEVGKLSARAQNVITDVIGSEPLMKLFLHEFIDKDVRSLRNVGAKTAKELEFFVSRLLSALENAPSEFDEDEKLIFDLKTAYDLELDKADIVRLGSSEVEISKIILDQAQIIFFDDFHYFLSLIGEDSFSISKLADQAGLTRERLRQIVAKKRTRINHILKSIYDALSAHSSIRLESLVPIEKEGLNLLTPRQFDFLAYLSKEGIVQGIRLIDSDSLELAKVISKRIKGSFSNKQKVRSFFLSKSYLVSSLEYDKIVHVLRLLFGRLDEHDKIRPIQILLSDMELKMSSFRIIREILKDRFVIENKRGQLLFTLKNRSALVFMALDYFGSPTKLDKLYSFLRHHPDLRNDDEISKDTIRNMVIRNSDVFFSMGRKSLYGIKAWNKSDRYATKPIKEVCIDLLGRESDPIHKDEVVSCVLAKNRNWSARSISTILAQEDEVFASKHGFYWINKPEYEPDELPVSPATLRALNAKIVDKFELSLFWISLDIYMSELNKSGLSIPDYQSTHELHRKFIRRKDLISLSNLDSVDDLNESIDILARHEKVVQYIRTRYVDLNSVQKLKFKEHIRMMIKNEAGPILDSISTSKCINFFSN